MLVSIMKEKSLPSYTELDRALSETTLKLHASQVHGLITGLLCGKESKAATFEELVTGNKEAGETHELLQTLYDATKKQLVDFLFEFQIIVPSDANDLAERAEALTLWCQGFLTGLKLAEVQLIDREPSDVTEVIDDLIQIAKMNYEEVVASEEDEEAYVELIEYVRMGVIMVYQDLREDESAKNVQATKNLH